MQDLLDNLDAARELDIPVCQDTGMAVVFAEVGQEVHFTGGDFEAAVQEACAGAIRKGCCAALWWATHWSASTRAIIRQPCCTRASYRVKK